MSTMCRLWQAPFPRSLCLGCLALTTCPIQGRPALRFAVHKSVLGVCAASKGDCPAGDKEPGWTGGLVAETGCVPWPAAPQALNSQGLGWAAELARGVLAGSIRLSHSSTWSIMAKEARSR